MHGVRKRTPNEPFDFTTRNTFCGTCICPIVQVHNDRTVPIKTNRQNISAIRTLNKDYIAYFSFGMRDTAIFLLLV